MKDPIPEMEVRYLLYLIPKHTEYKIAFRSWPVRIRLSTILSLTTVTLVSIAAAKPIAIPTAVIANSSVLNIWLSGLFFSFLSTNADNLLLLERGGPLPHSNATLL